ncbi:hypothetical protein AK812_SmicGene24360 [Symbiodinium microadriaticum]|uniref:Uncharacterized protein n=1 Tax=Symbiodinium microadriaticum TaxID=2951 RepID=A0A1Q9DEW9_SYMMI|nr:hypothetical protein AK812_SmicGene24360 [Symbiodinium microadriaticum]
MIPGSILPVAEGRAATVRLQSVCVPVVPLVPEHSLQAASLSRVAFTEPPSFPGCEMQATCPGHLAHDSGVNPACGRRSRCNGAASQLSAERPVTSASVEISSVLPVMLEKLVTAVTISLLFAALSRLSSSRSDTGLADTELPHVQGISPMIPRSILPVAEGRAATVRLQSVCVPVVPLVPEHSLQAASLSRVAFTEPPSFPGCEMQAIGQLLTLAARGILLACGRLLSAALASSTAFSAWGDEVKKYVLHIAVPYSTKTVPLQVTRAGGRHFAAIPLRPGCLAEGLRLQLNTSDILSACEFRCSQMGRFPATRELPSKIVLRGQDGDLTIVTLAVDDSVVTPLEKRSWPARQFGESNRKWGTEIQKVRALPRPEADEHWGHSSLLQLVQFVTTSVIVLHLSGAPTEPQALEVYWTPNLKLFNSGGFAGFGTHFYDSRRWRSRRDAWTGGRGECGTRRRLEAVVPLILEWTSSRSAASGDHGEPLEVGHRKAAGALKAPKPRMDFGPRAGHRVCVGCGDDCAELFAEVVPEAKESHIFPGTSRSIFQHMPSARCPRPRTRDGDLRASPLRGRGAVKDYTDSAKVWFIPPPAWGGLWLSSKLKPWSNPSVQRKH